MRRISRTSSTRTGYRATYVNPLGTSDSVRKVEPPPPIERTANETAKPSNNFILSYERYKQYLKELKQVFKSFYFHEKELYHTLQAIGTNKEELISQTCTLICKYNETLKSIRKLDQLFQTSYMDDIQALHIQHQKELEALGLLLNDNGTLTLNIDVFRCQLSTSDQDTMAVLKRFKSLLLKQYHTISQLQVPNSHQMSPYDPPGEPLKGFIIEEKG
ncbi:hypothetical protein [Halalkalibacterium halodurans]|uniref:Uncharacterized protein n=1 Tax=Halalkalibacterium halodurans TaxID=86665 RepID=A0A0M0KHN4_ALKHA|nr:hypothetical protein [Halalkalibacterium halodurans]TPE69720.1 hypothetical protein AMD02_007185 [Halalkalibacterium halodurans]